MGHPCTKQCNHHKLYRTFLRFPEFSIELYRHQYTLYTLTNQILFETGHMYVITLLKHVLFLQRRAGRNDQKQVYLYTLCLYSVLHFGLSNMSEITIKIWNEYWIFVWYGYLSWYDKYMQNHITKITKLMFCGIHRFLLLVFIWWCDHIFIIQFHLKSINDNIELLPSSDCQCIESNILSLARVNGWLLGEALSVADRASQSQPGLDRDGEAQSAC